MTTINDLKIMNDTLINYYKDYEPQNEKKLLKHRIIKEILEMKDCFSTIIKEDAIEILRDIGISEQNIDKVYKELKG